MGIAKYKWTMRLSEGVYGLYLDGSFSEHLDGGRLGFFDLSADVTYQAQQQSDGRRKSQTVRELLVLVNALITI